MNTASDRRSLTQTVLLTLLISTVTTLIIGSVLYYTLNRHDRLHAQTLEQAAQEAGKQQALAAGRVLGALSRHVIQDVGRLQELVNTGLDSENLRDFLLVSRDNVVLAAKNNVQVGQQLRDGTWLAWKGQQRQIVQAAVDQAGQPVWVIVAPLKDQGDILAWAMLVFSRSEGAIRLPSPMARLTDTARLMAPIFVLILISVGVAMRVAAADIRRQIQGVMAAVLDQPSEMGRTDWLRKVS